MSAYIDAGYVAALGTLAVYGTTLVVRERAARRRLSQADWPSNTDLEGDDPGDSSAGGASEPSR